MYTPSLRVHDATRPSLYIRRVTLRIYSAHPSLQDRSYMCTVDCACIRWGALARSLTATQSQPAGSAARNSCGVDHAMAHAPLPVSLAIRV
jgi:hypothetical protein